MFYFLYFVRRRGTGYIVVLFRQGLESVFAKPDAHSEQTVVIGPIVDRVAQSVVFYAQGMHGAARVTAYFVHRGVVKPNVACKKRRKRFVLNKSSNIKNTYFCTNKDAIE